MELILALLIGTILVGRYTSDKRSANKARAKHNVETGIANAFLSQYAVSTVETNAIEQMVINMSQEILVVDKELESIIGMKPTNPMLVYGYLAKRGKIPALDAISFRQASNVLSNEHDLVWKNISAWKDMNIEEYREAKLKFLKWYDEELRSHGMPYSLMYIPAHYETGGLSQYYHIKNMRPISECYNLCPLMKGRINGATYSVMVLWKPVAVYAPNVLGVV